MSDILFQRASRLKLRFDTPKGQLSVDDLWDLPLTADNGRANLDDIAIGLFRLVKDDSVSFVKEAKPNEIAQLKLDIVKFIIDVRMAEKKQAEEAKARAENKQKILAIIASKENAELEGKSLEDLRKLAEGL